MIGGSAFCRAFVVDGNGLRLSCIRQWEFGNGNSTSVLVGSRVVSLRSFRIVSTMGFDQQLLACGVMGGLLSPSNGL